MIQIKQTKILLKNQEDWQQQIAMVAAMSDFNLWTHNIDISDRYSNAPLQFCYELPALPKYLLYLKIPLQPNMKCSYGL